MKEQIITDKENVKISYSPKSGVYAIYWPIPDTVAYFTDVELDNWCFADLQEPGRAYPITRFSCPGQIDLIAFNAVYMAQKKCNDDNLPSMLNVYTFTNQFSMN